MDGQMEWQLENYRRLHSETAGQLTRAALQARLPHE